MIANAVKRIVIAFILSLTFCTISHAWTHGNSSNSVACGPFICDANGWAIISPKPVTSGSCNVSPATANGTCVIYVNPSAGTDATCTWVAVGTTPTTANTCVTLFQATQVLETLANRPNAPDWILLAKNQSWTESGHGGTIEILNSGFSSQYPLVYGAYDPNNIAGGVNPQSGGARPIINCTGSGNGGATTNFATTQIIAFIGIEFYCPRTDPTNALFNTADLAFAPTALNIGSSNFPAQSVYMEDCKFSWWGNGVSISGPLNVSGTSQWIRRNVFFNILAPTGNLGRGNGLVVEPFQTQQIFGNIFNTSGWVAVEQLSITAGTPGVATWTSAPPGWAGNNNDNGKMLFLYPTTGLGGPAMPNNLAQGTLYFVTDSGVPGTNQFHLSATVAGSNISTAGGTNGNYYAVFQNEFGGTTHGYYNVGINPGNPIFPDNWQNNIYVNAENSAAQIRTGGIAQYNLFGTAIQAEAYAAPPNQVNCLCFNLFEEGGAGPNAQLSKDNYVSYAGNNPTLDNNLIINAKVASGALWLQIGEAYSGSILTNNIVYNQGTVSSSLANGSILSFSGVANAGSGGTGAVSGINSSVGGGTAIPSPPGSNTTYTNVPMSCSTCHDIGASGTTFNIVIGTNGKCLGPAAGGTLYQPFAFSFANVSGIALAVNTRGVRYSTGDILNPSTSDNRVVGAVGSLNEIPNDCTFIVGSMPEITIDDVQGNIAISGGSGTLAIGFLQFISNSGTVTGLNPSIAIDNTTNGAWGINFIAGDTVSFATTESLSGFQATVGSVSSNSLGSGNNTSPATPSCVGDTTGHCNLPDYCSHIGTADCPLNALGVATTDQLYIAMTKQSKANYKSDLGPCAIINWTRAGFGLSSIQCPPGG